ncbi:hypothetical protein BU16DRAFT_623448 [Lophium mytilinum]|uniref:Uncharacterized protein n=1 Tax=Lophium mytilinum TaxID=390894 RepID=A0A6A6Q8R1_9PEZI|nr:hypothetical protein BU16DRAFT_623448 [Lophium mytilinum]
MSSPNRNPASPGKAAGSPGKATASPGKATPSPGKATPSSSGIYIPTSPTDGEAIMPAARPATPDAVNETRPPVLPALSANVDLSAYETPAFLAAEQMVLGHRVVGRMTRDGARTYTMRIGGPLPMQNDYQFPTADEATALAIYMKKASYDVRAVVHGERVWLFVIHSTNRAEDEAYWIQDVTTGHALSAAEVASEDAARTWGR